jgi:hypothetical protein
MLGAGCAGSISGFVRGCKFVGERGLMVPSLAGGRRYQGHILPADCFPGDSDTLVSTRAQHSGSLSRAFSDVLTLVASRKCCTGGYKYAYRTGYAAGMLRVSSTYCKRMI